MEIKIGPNDVYLGGLENSYEVDMLLRVARVVAHFLHPLVEPQEQLMMHLMREKRYARLLLFYSTSRRGKFKIFTSDSL